MKRLLKVFTALMMTAAVTSCSSSAKPSSSSKAEEEKTAEVTPTPEPTPVPTPEPTPEADQLAEEIEAALAGTWAKGQATTFTFDNGTVTRNTNGKISEGTYEIITRNSEIRMRIVESVGSTNVHLPYTFEDGVLTLDNGALVKQ